VELNPKEVEAAIAFFQSKRVAGQMVLAEALRESSEASSSTGLPVVGFEVKGWVARLLTGEMPDGIEEAFGAAKVALFPKTRHELDTSCSCPDWANPCKHVAAVFYILAEAFDDDPFLIFAFRGRTKEQVIERLRAIRSVQAESEAQATGGATAGEAESPPLSSSLEHFWRADEGLSDLKTRPVAAEVSDAVLRQLGRAPVWIGGSNLVDLLAKAYGELAKRAAELGSGD